jgi:hypothetical protein
MKRSLRGFNQQWLCMPMLVIGSFGLLPSTAQATPGDLLLRTGQVLPGDPDQQPVDVIADFGIDSSLNVAVQARNREYNRPNIPGEPRAGTTTVVYEGIYLLSPGQTAKLIEGAESRLRDSFGTPPSRVGVRLPVISLGQVAYVLESSGFKAPRLETLKFFSAGTTKKIIDAAPSFAPATVATNTLATVNGKVYFFVQPGLGPGPQYNGIVQYANGQSQTVVAADDPAITAGGKSLLRPIGDTDFILRASSETLVFSRSIRNADGTTIIQIFEKPNGKALRKVYEVSGNLCGLAASRSNIVLCLNGRILARRGNTTQFTPIVTPDGFSKTQLQPSISNETVVFVERQSVPGLRSGGETLYLSRPNQPLRQLVNVLGSRDRLGSVLGLSENGQSINGSAVVYRYAQPDGAVELRRIKLQ